MSTHSPVAKANRYREDRQDDSNLKDELESQIILRLPEVPAAKLRDALKQDSIHFKDRLQLKLDVEHRKGILYFDDYVLHCKLVDLPCIIESHKTIDKKTIYKTADICQMLLCTEEEEPEEEPKIKKHHSLKVERRFLFPHGVTPPLKSVRKRRFRKTLKKKQHSEQQELEKEVKQLLREDQEAVHIKWEIIADDDSKAQDGTTINKDSVLMEGTKTGEELKQSMLAAQIFGGELSDSDADDDDRGASKLEDDDDDTRTSDDNSRSHLSDSMMSENPGESSKSTPFATSFRDIFQQGSPSSSGPSTPAPRSSSPGVKIPSRAFEGVASSSQSQSRGEIQAQLTELQSQLNDIRSRRQNLPDNVALRKRLEPKLLSEEREKEEQIRKLENKLHDM